MSERTAAGQGTSGRGVTAPLMGPSADADAEAAADAASVKRRLRSDMRRLRRELTGRAARSEALWRHVSALPEVAGARRIMGFADVAGEPETDGFRDRWRAGGGEWAEPESGVEPGWPDVVLVPGLAFTRSGDRLGQGGGWYDRFLPGVRPDCVTIGVGFAEQVIDDLPVERHDVTLDRVVVDTGPVVS